MSIQRGSTPVHIFKTSADLTDADVIFITYQQAGRTIIEKDKSDCQVSKEQIQVMLTQEETLLLKHSYGVSIQVRARFNDGTAIVSNIIHTDVGTLLKNGVI